MADKNKLKEILLSLSDIGAICFGEFTLKSGIKSPVYIDLRTAMCQPDLLMDIADVVWNAAVKANLKADVVCGVPTGAIPLATCVSVHSKMPMIFCRKEAKKYGRQRPVEGKYQDGETCIVIEDVFVSGQSTMETVELLKGAGFKVSDAIAFLNREQGGERILEKEGIKLRCAVTISEMLNILHEAGKITADTYGKCKEFISTTQLTALPRHLETARKPEKLSYKVRADLCKHPLTKQLFTIMATKKTNLALSADVTTCDELIKLADELGPHLCMLKTHVDILTDFSKEKILEVQKLAEKHSFLIFEDRKFADIGNTVKLQYEGGSYAIADWAHIINAHPLPGPGIIQGLKNVGSGKNRACVLVAEMSSVDHLCTKEYVQATVEMANRSKDFIIGFICQSYLTSDPEMLHMVPGVKLERGNDGLGQGYMTVTEAFNLGADLIIVGRGILQSANYIATTKTYQYAGYVAYENMIAKETV